MTLFPHNCEKDGHRFEARYDEIPIGGSLSGCWPDQAVEIIKANTKKIYVKDICTRCGKEIGR